MQWIELGLGWEVFLMKNDDIRFGLAIFIGFIIGAVVSGYLTFLIVSKNLEDHLIAKQDEYNNLNDDLATCTSLKTTTQQPDSLKCEKLVDSDGLGVDYIRCSEWRDGQETICRFDFQGMECQYW